MNKENRPLKMGNSGGLLLQFLFGSRRDNVSISTIKK